MQSKADYSLFCSHDSVDTTLVVVYVDDILVTGSNCSKLQKLKAMLQQCFSIKDLGPMKFYIGLEFSRTAAGIFVHQRKYIL